MSAPKPFTDAEIEEVAAWLETRPGQRPRYAAMMRQLLAQRREADEVIATNEGEWALPNIMKLAPWYDAAIARHKARLSQAGKEGK